MNERLAALGISRPAKLSSTVVRPQSPQIQPQPTQQKYAEAFLPPAPQAAQSPQQEQSVYTTPEEFIPLQPAISSNAGSSRALTPVLPLQVASDSDSPPLVEAPTPQMAVPASVFSPPPDALPERSTVPIASRSGPVYDHSEAQAQASASQYKTNNPFPLYQASQAAQISQSQNSLTSEQADDIFSPQQSTIASPVVDTFERIPALQSQVPEMLAQPVPEVAIQPLIIQSATPQRTASLDSVSKATLDSQRRRQRGHVAEDDEDDWSVVPSSESSDDEDESMSGTGPNGYSLGVNSGTTGFKKPSPADLATLLFGNMTSPARPPQDSGLTSISGSSPVQAIPPAPIPSEATIPSAPPAPALAPVFGAPAPPAPPPPPAVAAPPDVAVNGSRKALLGQIEAGRRLRSVQTIDKSQNMSTGRVL